MVFDFGLIPNYKFLVDLGGGNPINFEEVVLPESEVEIIEYRGGSDVLSSSRKIPGRVKYTNLILKRGLTQSSELYNWFKQSKNGTPDLKDISVKILDKENEPVATWKLSNCWPTKYSGPVLNSTQSELTMEVVEIATQDVDIELN